MGIVLKNKKHFFIRFPLWLAIIVFISFSPFIIGFIGSFFTELITNEPCHEGNCFWGTIPWLGILFTLPIGGILLVIYLIIIVIDYLRLVKK